MKIARYLILTFLVYLVGTIIAGTVVLTIVARLGIHNPLLQWAVLGIAVWVLIKPTDYMWRKLT